MIKEIQMYTIVCDNCKATDEAWESVEIAEYIAKESHWHKQDDKHYCPDCWDLNHNNEVCINQERFKQ